MLTSRTIGAVMFISISVFYAYYTIWILVTPIVDSDHPLQQYFPDRMFGIMTTTLLAYCQLAFMLTSAGIILVRDSAEEDPAQNHTLAKSTTLPTRQWEENQEKGFRRATSELTTKVNHQS